MAIPLCQLSLTLLFSFNHHHLSLLWIPPLFLPVEDVKNIFASPLLFNLLPILVKEPCLKTLLGILEPFLKCHIYGWIKVIKSGVEIKQTEKSYANYDLKTSNISILPWRFLQLPFILWPLMFWVELYFPHNLSPPTQKAKNKTYDLCNSKTHLNRTAAPSNFFPSISTISFTFQLWCSYQISVHITINTNKEGNLQSPYLSTPPKKLENCKVKYPQKYLFIILMF